MESNTAYDRGDEPSAKWLVAAVYVLALFMSLLDLTITNVALPRLTTLYAVSSSTVAWIATGYLLSVAVCIPVSGWLGDRFGTKRTFVAALGIFTLASLLCGLADSVGELIGFRVLQGIGGGLMTPVGATMVLRAFPLRERARAAAVMTIPAVVAPALGPVLGGYLVEAWSWRWVFLINLPIGVITMLVAGRSLREHRVAGTGGLDLPGFLLSAFGLATLVYALGAVADRGAGDVFALALGLVGLAALSLFVAVEFRTAHPLIDPRLYRDRLFAAGNIVLFCVNARFFGVVFLLPLFLQAERGLGPLGSGLATFPTALGIMVVAPVAGRLYGRFGPRRLVMSGTALGAVVSLAFQQVDLETDLWAIRALVLPMGVAFGLVFIPLRAASFANIGPEAAGHATAAYNTVRQIASARGIAVQAAILALRLEHNGATLGNPTTRSGSLAAFHDAFAVAALLSLLGLTATLLISDRLAAVTMDGGEEEGPTRRAVTAIAYREEAPASGGG